MKRLFVICCVLLIAAGCQPTVIQQPAPQVAPQQPNINIRMDRPRQAAPPAPQFVPVVPVVPVYPQQRPRPGIQIEINPRKPKPCHPHNGVQINGDIGIGINR